MAFYHTMTLCILWNICIYNIPGSSTYVKILALGRFFWWKGTNFTHLEDPGIHTYFSNTISYKPISVNPSHDARVYQVSWSFLHTTNIDHQPKVLGAQTTVYHKDRVIDHCTKWKMLESFWKELKQLLSLKGKVEKKKGGVQYSLLQDKKKHWLQPFLYGLKTQKKNAK